MTSAKAKVKETALVGLSLLVLWALSWGLSYLPPSPWSLAIALAIAGLKGLLVVMFFMELGREAVAVRAAAVSAVVLVGLLLAFTLADRALRGDATEGAPRSIRR